jgi:hypothetical protein
VCEAGREDPQGREGRAEQADDHVLGDLVAFAEDGGQVLED